MNRVDRMLAVVLELQARKQARAEDLAATFEVSKRTIYRDVMALAEAGVPVVAVPGQGYSLVEGYFLPPLSFTPDEAMTLLLGSDLAAQSFDAQYRSAAQSASHKIVTVLPEERRHEVNDLKTSIQFMSDGEPAALEMLQELRQAIVQRIRIRFRYHTRYHNNTSPITSREADPYALIHIGGAWMLIAYCHLRREQRYFRLDRMDDLTLLKQTFTRPQHFKIQLSPDDDRTILIRALFDHVIVRRVQEAPSLYQVAQEDHPDGVVITFAVRRDDDMLNWLLSWGSHVQVLEPQSLIDLMAREAEAMLRKHALKDRLEVSNP